MSVHWSTYHTVRKPVRQTPNKDECPRRQKRKVRLFSRCRLNFSNVSFYIIVYIRQFRSYQYADICVYMCILFPRSMATLCNSFKSSFLKNPTGKLVEMELRDKFLRRMDSTMCFLIVGFRMLARADWTRSMIAIDVKLAALCAISKGVCQGRGLR